MDQTWWIDEPFLLGCSYPREAELPALRAAGFEVIVNLLDGPQDGSAARARAAGFEWHNVPVEDISPANLAQFDEFFDLVHGRRAVVHCFGGMGRTGMFGAAYLVARGCNADDAIATIRARRPGAIPPGGQEAAVRAYARLRLDRAS